ncbi:MarR family winged helix-turn-helix transcriptional regulator [Micromonospora sp. NBC_01796]|uniref:MarR family winged helix-turn-helix transcriptional regulator n=1 Tax=Micromonospora sp. NBC_01796 TaxID=2975987 RepID=UPI002DDA275A|nr:MarR family transcriptional regulator [Micromonospora sp. NBC_01796]WSA83603.1 MarR family transcriptional regulator [Micromonospora sp. NBC_01796]
MEQRDGTDDHVDRWLPVLPGLDPDVEGVVTRAARLARHLLRMKERYLVAFDFQRHEFDTLHVLAGRRGRATPTELAADLDMAPPSVTARLDALERRGFVRRIPSTTDRRRVDIELTEAGNAAWLEAMEVLGHEDHRLLDALDPAERRTLADLLRRVMIVAEQPHPTPDRGADHER